MKRIVFACALVVALVAMAEALPQGQRIDGGRFPFPSRPPSRPVPCVCVTQPCPCDGYDWPPFDHFRLSEQ
nr:arasin-like protein [Penaeus vannamei]